MVEDFLSASKFAYVGLSHLVQAAIGSSVGVSGFGISPTSPASLSVNIADGSIYAMEAIDPNAYSTLGTDANQIMKQGILIAPTTVTVTPPSTSGFSQYYLVQVAFNEVDANPIIPPYFNTLNPAVPLNGAGGTGAAQDTVRQNLAVIGLKAGAAAATGSQAIPAPDAGFTALWAINVPNGTTQITSANWTQMSTDSMSAPWFPNLESLDSRYLKIPPTSTFYINGTSGSDTLYDGTAATISGPHGPFLTISGALLYIQTRYASPGAVTVNIAAGSYSGASISSSFVNTWSFIGSGVGTCTVTGVSASSGRGFIIGTGCTVSLDQIKLASIGGVENVNIQPGAACLIGTCNFTPPPTTGTSIGVVGGKLAQKSATNTWTFANGTYASFIAVGNGGTVQLGYNDGFTAESVALAWGTSTVTAGTISASSCGNVSILPGQITQTNTVTGPRYNCNTAGGINSQGGGISFLAGTTAGVATTPGWYV